MSLAAMLGHMLLERLSRARLERVPEPEPVMDGAERTAAFCACGRDDALLAPVYAFHALQAVSAIGDAAVVLDLACGPANQLVHMARLHPQARFVGVDRSETMLELARDTVARAGVDNVELRHGDIARLDAWSDATVDAVTCTMSMHHLPDTAALGATMAAAARVLRPGGGVYLADFGRLRRAATQFYFSHEHAAIQPPAFTADFHHSLRAAFSMAEIGAALGAFGGGVTLYRTALAPFMVVARRAARHPAPAPTLDLARAAHGRLSPAQRRDLAALSAWFAVGGLRSAFPLSELRV